MENLLNNPPDGTQLNPQNPEGQPEPKVVPEEQFKNLQSDYTKRVESEIGLAEKLVRANPKELTTIEDSRVKDAVAKRVYGMDYAQLIAINGETFYQTKEEEELDRTTALERELKLLKYNSNKENMDNAIRNFYSSNNELTPTQEQKDALIKELQYISGELPAEERVSRAAKIVYGQTNSVNAAYRQVAVQNSGQGNISQNEIAKKAAETERQKQIDETMKFLKLK